MALGKQNVTEESIRKAEEKLKTMRYNVKREDNAYIS